MAISIPAAQSWPYSAAIPLMGPVYPINTSIAYAEASAAGQTAGKAAASNKTIPRNLLPCFIYSPSLFRFALTARNFRQLDLRLLETDDGTSLSDIL